MNGRLESESFPFQQKNSYSGPVVRGRSHSAGSTSISKTPVSQQTRHARRIYVGGIPPSYSDEELLTSFLNAVISKGLGEDNTSSYVLSMYINQKKCFAFVELVSIELTTACLELDGIVYKSSVLKILRANEYKPELVPPVYSAPIKLNLPASLFTPPVLLNQLQQSDQSDIEETSDLLGLESNIYAVERGSVVIIGFPYDEGSRRAGLRQGSASAPKSIRRLILKGGFGVPCNPEFDIDTSQVPIHDVGDIPGGLSLEEAHMRLSTVIAEVLRRGATPFVIGGSSDLSYYCSAGLLSVMGGAPMGVVNVSSTLHVKSSTLDGKVQSGCSMRQLLEDGRFLSLSNRSSDGRPSCEGRLVQFGAQGAMCPADQAQFVTERGGRIIWLSKDLRPSILNSFTVAGPPGQHVLAQFEAALREVGGGAGLGQGQGQGQQQLDSPSGGGKRRPVHVSLRADAISEAVLPGAVGQSSIGLSVEEALDICFVAGADHNVAVMDVTEFNPDIEEHRSRRFVVDLLYRFVLGFASRRGGGGKVVAGAANAPPGPGSAGMAGAGGLGHISHQGHQSGLFAPGLGLGRSAGGLSHTHGHTHGDRGGRMVHTGLTHRGGHGHLGYSVSANDLTSFAVGGASRAAGLGRHGSPPRGGHSSSLNALLSSPLHVRPLDIGSDTFVTSASTMTGPGSGTPPLAPRLPRRHLTAHHRPFQLIAAGLSTDPLLGSLDSECDLGASTGSSEGAALTVASAPTTRTSRSLSAPEAFIGGSSFSGHSLW